MEGQTDVQKLKELLKKHPDMEICMNSNGVKIGFKGTDQSTWKRYAWGKRAALNVEKISQVIDSFKPTYDVTPFDDDTHSSGANIQKYIRGLGREEMADIKSFIRFAKKEGYLKKDASMSDLKTLVKTWWEKNK